MWQHCYYGKISINYLLHRFGYLTIFVFPSYCSWQVLNNPLTRHTNWKTLLYSGQTWHPGRPTWCPRVCRCSRYFRFRYCSCYCCCWGQPHQKPGHLPVPVTDLGEYHRLAVERWKKIRIVRQVSKWLNRDKGESIKIGPYFVWYSTLSFSIKDFEVAVQNW